MRKPMMAGNWKMNKTIDEAVELARTIRGNVAGISTVDRVLCPAFVCLPVVREVVKDTSIAIGAQNMHWAESGAYTGEVSGQMLRKLVEYVIIGHSERRQYFGETDEDVNKKIHTALRFGFIPIVCVGETLIQNEGGETHSVVGGQVGAALAGLTGDQVKGIVIAYEPIWAIGTGKAATAQQAQQICGDTVRQTLVELYDSDVAQATRILYGGSTNAKNIAEIMQQPDIDGALIGGASLQAENYSAMVRTTAALYG